MIQKEHYAIGKPELSYAAGMNLADLEITSAIDERYGAPIL